MQPDKEICRSTACACSGAASRRSSTRHTESARRGRRARARLNQNRSGGSQASPPADHPGRSPPCPTPQRPRPRPPLTEGGDTPLARQFHLVRADGPPTRMPRSASHEVVGWTAADRTMADLGDFRYPLLSRGERPVAGLFELNEEMCASGAQPGWMGVIGVADTDAAAKRIAEAGGAVLKAPDDIPISAASRSSPIRAGRCSRS